MNSTFDALSWIWSETSSIAQTRGRQGPGWQPPVDIYETELGLTILIALPGVAADRITLYIDPRGLTLQTERIPRAARQCARILRLEIPYGPCERHIELPAGRYTLVQQRMIDGCLELQLTRE